MKQALTDLLNTSRVKYSRNSQRQFPLFYHFSENILLLCIPSVSKRLKTSTSSPAVSLVSPVNLETYSGTGGLLSLMFPDVMP